MIPPPKPNRGSRGLKGRFSRATLERIVVFTVVSIAGALVWWSVARFTTVRSEARDLSGQVARLTGDIDIMRARWTEARTQHIAQHLPAAQAALFPGPAAVREWMDSIHATATPLAFRSEFEFVSAHTQDLAHPVAIMQTRLHLQDNPDTASTRPAYHRLLTLGQAIAQNPRRLDILHLQVTGSSGSVANASAVIDVWAENPAAGTP